MVIMIVIVILADRIAENSRCRRACYRDTRVDGLNGPALGVVCGGATDASADGDQ